MSFPEKLGKYDVLGEIDRGSMGTVYLGHDPYIDRGVAIKVAHSEALKNVESGDRYKKMFFNEAHTAGSLNHPNIVGIYDAGAEDDICYIVMELVKGGGTLKPYCTPENLLPIEKVVEIIFKCAKALDYAHKQGVVHRDIKPSNILVAEGLDVMIADFSIAQMNKADDTATQQVGLMGSPKYMSPEQLREDDITHQTDLFSLGIVMYEMLTGKHPFPAENFSRLVTKILNEDPPPLKDLRPDLPDALIEIFAKATEKTVEARYQTGLEFAIDLSKSFEALEGPEEDISEQEKFNSIKGLEFFKGFPDSEIWEIIRASNWQEYEMKDDIIVEGELDDCFYIIVQGEVGVVKNDQSIRMLGVGDCFGEMGYLAKTKRTATIKALTETALLKINSTVMSQVSLNCQVRFLKVFLRTLIHRLSMTTDKASQD
ncbi:MAG: serine/threonine protein kinase [Gammaproteobacteria bacterium]|jgi:serine/threonine protein kinase